MALSFRIISLYGLEPYRDPKREGTSLPHLTLDANATAVEFDESLCQREPQPCSLLVLRHAVSGLAELLEDQPLIRFRDAECRWAAAVHARGPEAELAEVSCLVRVTRARAARLGMLAKTVSEMGGKK